MLLFDHAFRISSFGTFAFTFYVLDRYSFIFVWMLYKAVRVLCCRESHARDLHASCKPERVSQSNLLCMMHFELLRNAVSPPFFSYIKLFSFSIFCGFSY